MPWLVEIGAILNAKGIPVAETLAFILYGGAPEEVPHRMWEALTDSRRKVELLGISSLGEIVGWALPDRYPPRNGRTSKSLRSRAMTSASMSGVERSPPFCDASGLRQELNFGPLLAADIGPADLAGAKRAQDNSPGCSPRRVLVPLWRNGRRLSRMVTEV